MGFSWNDYVVIQSGFIKEMSERNNIRSASALANVYNASYLGMGKREDGPDLGFQELARDLGLFEDRKTKKSLDQDPDEILDQTDKVLARAFSGDDEQ